MKEEWRSIEEFPEHQISSLGHVRRRLANGLWKTVKPRKEPIKDGEALMVQLVHKKKVKFFSLGVLLLRTFKPEFQKMHPSQIRYLDGNRLNASLDNLSWFDGGGPYIPRFDVQKEKTMVVNEAEEALILYLRSQPKTKKMGLLDKIQVHFNETSSQGEMAKHFNVSKQYIAQLQAKSVLFS